MDKNISNLFTSKEILRVVDLAVRRMVDYGIESYSAEDQKLFQKCKVVKQNFGDKYGCML